MSERNIHIEALLKWRAGWVEDSTSPTAMLDVFERATNALWRRARQSLGELTLMAIVDRVIHQGSKRFPHLALLKVETNGVLFAELLQQSPSLEPTRLEESLVFLLSELLRVFGTLTAEILTPGLHAELLKVRGPSTDAPGGKP